MNRYSIKNPSSFMNCMIDLKSLAEYCNLTYAEINLLIYVVLFILIILVNFCIYKFVKNKS